MIKKITIKMASLPLDYLNELLSFYGENEKYATAAPVIARIHKGIRVEDEEVDVELPDPDEEVPDEEVPDEEVSDMRDDDSEDTGTPEVEPTPESL